MQISSYPGRLFGVLAIVLGIAAGAIYFSKERTSQPTNKRSVSRARAKLQAGAELSGSVDASRTTPLLAIPSQTGEPAASLSGSVRDGSGEGISKARITAVLELGPGSKSMAPVSPSPQVVAVASDGGVFSFSNLPAGRYRLRISGPGLIGGEVRFVSVPVQDLVLFVSREVSIRGRVAGFSDLGSVGIILSSESGTTVARQEPNLDGSFKFSNLAEGRYRMWALAKSSASPSQWIVRRGVQRGKDGSVLLKMQKGRRLVGRVVESGPTSMGLAANVVIRSQGEIEPARHVVSSADGSFSVETLLPGKWSAQATVPGYLDSRIISLAESEDSIVTLKVHSGSEVRGVVRIAGGGSLAGSEVQLVGTSFSGEKLRYGGASSAGRSGEPATVLADSRLAAGGELGVLLGPIPLVPALGMLVTRTFRAGSHLSSGGDLGQDRSPFKVLGKPGQGITDLQGRYWLTGVASGHYRLLVNRPGYAKHVSPEFTIARGSRVLRRNLRLRAGTVLSGVVVSETGATIAGASVTASFSDRRSSLMMVSNADGVFEFAPMTGNLKLSIEAIGYGHAERELKLKSGELAPLRKNIRVPLAAANFAIEGRLVDSSGFSVRGARLSVVQDWQQRPSAVATSDRNGLFRIEALVQGVHSLKIEHSQYPTMISEASTEKPASLVLLSGALLILECTSGQSGSPLQGAHVSIQFVALPPSSVLSKQVLRATTDKTGTAKFSALSPGRYQMQVRRKGFATVSKEIHLRALEGHPSTATTEVVALVRGSILAGVLSDADGERVSGAILRVGESSTRSNSDGKFRLVDVPSGAQELAIELGGQGQTIEVQVEAGEERVTMEVRFDPKEHSD